MRLPFRFQFDRALAYACALAVLAAGLIIGAVNENAMSRQKLRDLDVQASTFARGVAAPLMFEDATAAAENAVALGQNPDVDAAGVYNEAGALIASFKRDGAAAPPERVALRAPAYRGAFLDTARMVQRDGQTYGAVYLRMRRETILARLTRSAPTALLFLMTALVLGVVGAAHGALRRTLGELERKAQDLEHSNARLEEEMEHRKQAEEALLQSRKMEAIGQLTGGVAHDFNNLLTVVLSGLKLMERNPDPERRVATVEAMRQAVERGAGLTRQLLAFARRQTLKLEAIDVGQHLNGMRELLERSLRADILVDITTPPDLWPVKTDPTQFELAILNLAVNARDAMPRGGVLTISAKNEVTLEGDFVEIEVRDTGVGISPDVLQRVFEPYFTTKQAGQGTGLGLAQVYGIVAQSGGAAKIESAVNEGTRVKLVLPRSVTAPEHAGQTPQHGLSLASAAGKSVLVVEDDDAVARVVGELLSQMGCAPTRVNNASDALEAIDRGTPYDLVFSDIVMPGAMNGVDLAHEIRKRRPKTPIVLTTGFSGAAKVDVEFPIVRKPYQVEELEQVLAAAFERSQTAA